MTITAPFAKITNVQGTLQVRLFPSVPLVGSGYEDSIENVKIEESPTGAVTITGDAQKWKYTYETCFITDPKTIHPNYLKEEFKTVIDFFRRKKSPCVKSGWYRLNESTPYKVTTNVYKIC